MSISPFPEGYRRSGILLHISSLPTAYGIGDFGPSARRWVDWLAHTGQGWWQVLPLGPTGFGNCPYQLTSTFGGNPLFISPELLIAEGLLPPADYAGEISALGPVDYDAATSVKQRVIALAWRRFQSHGASELRGEYDQFIQAEQTWLDDYALFESLRREFQTGSFWNWPAPIAHHEPLALLQAREHHRDTFEEIRFGQFLALRQLRQLKEYANSHGIQLIGDLPFFVSRESADVWANADLFLLNGQLHPLFVAGVPPDYFSPDGQLWGNPVYNWEAMRRTGYDWWIRRARALWNYVDVIRLDHFRGFAAAWYVPASAQSALSGEWHPGPGADFFQTLRGEFSKLPFLAEDLGEITPDVCELRDAFQLSGMCVAQFAFDGSPDNPFLPRNIRHNTVAFTATHDNNTTQGWFDSLSDEERQVVSDNVGSGQLTSSTVTPDLIRLIWDSAAALTIVPMQDVLNLGSEHRMNIPGQADGNWRWRLTRDQPVGRQLAWLGSLTAKANRAASPLSTK